MSLPKLAFSNFKRSVKEYMALIVSLAFSAAVFFNFENILYSDSMDVLNTMNKQYIDMIVQTAAVVFIIFLFFFIWYATNVFLKQRKKEIGIYTFMGLDNMRIGKMYVLEAFFIGLFSLLAGLLFGTVFSKLFQMLLLKMSDISADIRFTFALPPFIITSIVFGIIFVLMIFKGYVSIIRSSVLSLLSGAKQEETKPQKAWIVLLKVVSGLAVLAAGYICALSTGGIDSVGYAFAAVILVIFGVYLLFSGAIPFFIRNLTKRKLFLYQKQRNLWVNNLSFRIQRNYRTYAMVTVLMICSVTVLGISIAMKQRYEKSVHFKNTYTYQVISKQKLNEDEIARGISKENKVEYKAKATYLMLNPDMFETQYKDSIYGIIPFSEVKNISKQAGLPLDFSNLENDEVVELTHVYLMSFGGTDTGAEIKIDGKDYRIKKVDDTAFLGALQQMASIFVVNDEVYQKLTTKGNIMYTYNYKIKNPANADASRSYLNTLIKQDENGKMITGVSIIEPDNKEEAWIRVMYSLCIFMFATLILAAGSIIFIKLNNDAYEDRERYGILRKLGIGDDTLFKSMKNEIRFTYYCPFVLMVISSWFSIKALGNVMTENLLKVNIYSTVSVLVAFTLIYFISVRVFRRKVL